MVYRNGLKGQVYCLHDAEHSICRIGKTDSVVRGRRQKEQIAYYPFELITYNEDVPNAICFEGHLHRFFKEKKKKGDWYNISPIEFKEAVILAREEYEICLNKDTDKENFWNNYKNTEEYKKGEEMKAKKLNDFYSKHGHLFGYSVKKSK